MSLAHAHADIQADLHHVKPRRKRSKRPSLSRALCRQWRVGMLLQKQAWTCAELATELGISKPTAQRDLDILRRLFAITTHTERGHLQRVFYRMRGRFVAR